MKRTLSFLLGVFLLCPSLVAAAPVQWSSAVGGNDHYYEVILFGPIPGSYLNWDQARNEAAARTYLGGQGYLATLTSQTENNFVATNLLAPLAGLANYNLKDVWLGGYQTPNQANPNAGWNWVTGETWSYTNLGSSEFNDYGTVGSNMIENNEENWLEFSFSWYPEGRWSDIGPGPNEGRIVGYLAEYAVPIPGAVWLLASGLVGLVLVRRNRAR